MPETVHFIYGRTASGKSDLLYAKASESAKERHVYIIVPDREAVAAERKCAELDGGENIDVVTFSRLINYIFRKRGGICESYIGKGARKIIMYGVLCDLSEELECFGKISPSDLATVAKLTSERSELYKNIITPEELAFASDALSENPKLGAKLSDLAKIFSAYDGEVAKKWREPDGAISRACELCGDFFEGTDVFIDSFISFTKQQYRMLGKIFAGANDTYISLGYVPDEDRDSTAFVSLAETDKRLHTEIKKAGAKMSEPTVLSRRVRYKSKELEFLAINLFSIHNYEKTYSGGTDNVVIAECRNKYEEAEIVSVDIAKRVREGYRYRDIAIIARDTETYAGIIDAELEKADIPYYISHRTDIDERGIVKFIYSAYACISRGFRRKDIIEYIKTDYAGISGDECDLLENYIIKWKLQGKRFVSDEVWSYPLRGYEDREREGDGQTLSLLNELREKIKAPLLRFAGVVGNCRTVREHATALYDFLLAMKIPQRLKTDAEHAKSMGDGKGAEEYSQLWKVLMDTLDQAVGSAGEKSVNSEGFVRILKLAFSETDIGSIPTSVDEVLIGGAANTHTEAKIVYILGAGDGVFPKRISEEGLFSEYEKELLRKNGVEFSSGLEKSVSDENYYFYQTVCAPSEKLFITYTSDGKADGSAALRQIRRLLPDVATIKFKEIPKKDLIYSEDAALEYALSEDDGIALAMREYLSSAGYSERLSSASEPLSASACRLEKETAGMLFGRRLRTGYSRLESYIECHFRYFCDYELDISDDGAADFSAVNIGNFMHAAIEAAGRRIAEMPASEDGAGEAEKAEIYKAMKIATDKYISAVTGRPEGELSPRLRHITNHLFIKAKAFADRLCDEFLTGGCRFRPAEFEFPIGDGEKVRAIALDDGEHSVSLRGRVDRIDTFEDDGKLWLRVIDYKKSGKKFELSKIEKGLDMQMLLYLFSLCEEGKPYFGKEVLPAGVLYVESGADAKKIRLGEKEADRLSVSGIVTAAGDDRLELARAMEPDLGGRYLPFGKSSRKLEDKLLSEEALDALKTDIKKTVLGCAAEMKSGAAQAAPVDCKGVDACKYCKMKPICRIIKTKSEDDEDEDTGEYT